jgi:hypothetical protein
VDVDVVLLEEIGGNSLFVGVRAGVGQRGLRGLLHDLAELTGRDENLPDFFRTPF